MKAVLGILVLAACGGGGGGGDDDDTPMDTAQQDAVDVVTPCTGESASIESLADRFEPQSVTISVGQIVKMAAEPTGASHNIMPGIGVPTDPALMVGSGETKCFRFNTAGTYNFRCGIHGFTGSVVVQ